LASWRFKERSPVPRLAGVLLVGRDHLAVQFAGECDRLHLGQAGRLRAVDLILPQPFVVQVPLLAAQLGLGQVLGME
jgi:hypothetical protein